MSQTTIAITGETSLDNIRQTHPLTPATQGMWHLAGASFLKIILNPFNLGFSLAMPIFMYLMFGAFQSYSEYSVGNGNAGGQVLVMMGLFGVFLATASFGAAISLERVQGVSRLFALSPLPPVIQIVARLIANVAVGAILLTVTYLVGFSTGASMSGTVWAQSVLMTLVMSLLSSAIGFGCGFAIRSDGAFAATSAVLVLSAFGAGMTIPIEQMGGVFQSLAPWTPLWGASQLTLLPITGWSGLTMNMIVSVIVWASLFTGLAVWGLRRDTGR